MKLKKTFGQQTIGSKGSGGGTTEANIWVINGENNTLVPSAFHGAKWISTIPTTVSNNYSDLVVAETAATDTGIAVVRNIVTGERRLLINCPEAGSPFSEDLINGQLLQLSSTTVNISSTSPSGSYQFYTAYNKF